MVKKPKPAPPPAAAKPAAIKRPCQWPIGDPGAPGFRFCGAESAEGRSYCAEHVKAAYVPAR